MECKNYIRILHKTEDNRMYVCGTNAFDPECDYMVRRLESEGSLCVNIQCCINCCEIKKKKKNEL